MIFYHLRIIFDEFSIVYFTISCYKIHQLFYGTIYATGNVGISGRPNAMKLNIKAITERNTAIFLPLYNASEIQTSEFITFIHESDMVEEQSSGNRQRLGGSHKASRCA